MVKQPEQGQQQETAGPTRAHSRKPRIPFGALRRVFAGSGGQALAGESPRGRLRNGSTESQIRLAEMREGIGEGRYRGPKRVAPAAGKLEMGPGVRYGTRERKRIKWRSEAMAWFTVFGRQSGRPTRADGAAEQSQRSPSGRTSGGRLTAWGRGPRRSGGRDSRRRRAVAERPDTRSRARQRT